MSEKLDEITTDLINMFYNRRIPALIVSKNPMSDRDNDIRCKFTGTTAQLITMISTGAMVLADRISKDYNLPKEQAVEMAIDSIKDQVSIATAVQDGETDG